VRPRFSSASMRRLERNLGRGSVPMRGKVLGYMWPADHTHKNICVSKENLTVAGDLALLSRPQCRARAAATTLPTITARPQIRGPWKFLPRANSENFSYIMLDLVGGFFFFHLISSFHFKLYLRFWILRMCVNKTSYFAKRLMLKNLPQ